MTESILGAARLLWDYHRMGESPVPSDLILVLGSHDLRVADYAAQEVPGPVEENYWRPDIRSICYRYNPLRNLSSHGFETPPE